MQTACLIHWNKDEARRGIELLRAAGYSARHLLPKGASSLRKLAEVPPGVIVIDLSRLPSQGRDIGILLRRNGRTRQVPLIFVEGDPEKLGTVKRHLPDATYSTWKNIRRALKVAARTVGKELKVPNSSLAGYSGTPLPKKLGIVSGSTVALVDAPEDFESTLGKLPRDVTLLRNPGKKQTLTLWFATSLHEYRLRVRRISEQTNKLWVMWPKKSSGVSTDLSEQIIRETGLSVGLVDFKVCAVDTTWSGLLFAHRKK